MYSQCLSVLCVHVSLSVCLCLTVLNGTVVLYWTQGDSADQFDNFMIIMCAMIQFVIIVYILMFSSTDTLNDFQNPIDLVAKWVFKSIHMDYF